MAGANGPNPVVAPGNIGLKEDVALLYRNVCGKMVLPKRVSGGIPTIRRAELIHKIIGNECVVAAGRRARIGLAGNHDGFILWNVA